MKGIQSLPKFITISFLLLLSSLFLFINNKDAKNSSSQVDTKSKNMDEVIVDSIECNFLSKCQDKEGIELEWRAGFTEEIVKRKEFLNQIPQNYTGKIKLCSKKLLIPKEDAESKRCKGHNLNRYISCKNGKVEGISYSYDHDGMYEEGYFINGIAEGTWINYNNVGNYYYVRNYKNGRLHGERISYNDINLKLISEENFSNGELDGKIKEYYESGQIKKYQEYTNGKLNLSKTYYENGQLESDIKYGDRIKMEKCVFYDRNGKINGGLIKRKPLRINRP